MIQQNSADDAAAEDAAYHTYRLPAASCNIDHNLRGQTCMVVTYVNVNVMYD